MRTFFVVGVVVATACRSPSPESQAPGGQAPPESEAPVALNPDVPIAYPPALFDQKVEGDVVLRLFVDSTGKLIPDSTRIAESSGFPALDSAALAGSTALRFGAAKRRGVPVATAFLQPVEFRQVGTRRTGTGTVTLPPAPQPVRPPAPPPPPPAPPPAPPRARPRADTTRADTVPVRPTPPPAPPPAPDTTRSDTTRTRPDSGPPPAH